MKKENIHIDWELVSSILSNQADGSEKEQFKNWISEPENSELFSQIEKVWQETGDISYCYNAITNEAWEKVAARTVYMDKPKTRPIVPIMLKVAASVALMIALSWLYMGNRYEKVVANAEQILDYQLPDGSMASLNTNSKLRFKKGLAGSVREIWMDGEVFFDVKRDTLKPFVVHVLNADVTVLGTSFNVHTASENEIVKLDVLSGRVRFGSATTAVKAVVKAGESLKYFNRKGK
ncbi:MAG: FecR domain-containing protein, partial [Bacteroidales bacterium]|nr:FecR domain-containing protein [Bacteroidales bacterium]